VSVLDLSRWQFAITTVYHFLFVPITIGPGFFVAGFEAAWLRTKRERWLKLTKFYGRLFLINFALGVVTGIVQEFQFGMNWSAYSRLVGNIFGPPLAIEALLAFFLESTFLGLWIFGWDRLPPKLHNACMWVVATGTLLSAYFILAANAWMQHPVGYTYNPRTHQDNLDSFRAELFNPAQLTGFPHVIAGAFLTAGGLLVGISAWHILRRGGGQPGQHSVAEHSVAEHSSAFRSSLSAGAITSVTAMILLFVSGDVQGKLFTQHYQPMKMAAAEALYNTAQPAPLSLFTIGSLDGKHAIFTLELPRLLSFLGTGNWNGKVAGINDLQAQYAAQYGPGSYTPIIPLTYWSFRAMIGAGMLAALIAVIAWWALRARGGWIGLGQPGARLRAALTTGTLRRPLAWAVIGLPFLPLLGNATGWIMTEVGRQPWVVYGQMKTADGVSANSAGEVLASLIVFTLLYGVLAVIEAGLMFKYIRRGLTTESPPQQRDADAPLELVY
jgi:cytochrome bd ubiquinol oxidase subunit I